MTYEMVADKAKLDLGTRLRFLAYMRKRWPLGEDEARMSTDGYALEWATRFKNGIEYEASDIEGRMILKALWNKATGQEQRRHE